MPLALRLSEGLGVAWHIPRLSPEITSHVIEGRRRLSQPPPMKKLVIFSDLAPFSALTLAALWVHGYWGLFEPAFHSLAAAQVLMDLTIALSLFLVWMWRDASLKGRNPWPWLVLTLTVGSFGPLLYLLSQPTEK
jgi:Terpene cyclase DEP1